MIPKPFTEQPISGSLPLSKTVNILGELSDELCHLIQKDLESLLENCVDMEPGIMQIHIAFTPMTNQEAYVLKINEQGVLISASTNPGILYAAQSLKQLIYLAINSGAISLSGVIIEDTPRFQYRGLHLDVSRHFFDIDFIKQYLDWMLALKLNTFHWHLCDDQGWRIESKKYPLLHERGSVRIDAEGKRYGGYYLQSEIREVLAYAALRGIEVVPELDVPGHAQAILCAYPELACFPSDFECLNVWGISEDILCAGKDEVMEFLKELCAELAELFPGRYIHLGGDEVPKQRWRDCSHCQKRIKDLHIKDEEELQSWLLETLRLFLVKHHKEVIAWDEVLDGDIGDDTIVMVWRGNGIDAALMSVCNGNRYILCPNRYLYFDWKQSEADCEAGAHGVSTIQNVYDYPIHMSDLLMGLQANVWTEYMQTANEVKYMLFPRIYALAELAWSHTKDREGFLFRKDKLENYL